MLTKQLDRNDARLAFLASMLSLLVFGLTTAPSVVAGDVAELQYLPSRLGIPHPNGYPFYILLGWLWSKMPLSTLAWRMSFLSAGLGAVCVGLAYLLFRLTGLRRMSSLAGALTWAFQRAFWLYAGLAHRYTLLMLIGIGLLLAMSFWRKRGEPRCFLLAALLAGLGMASHIASPLFFLPGAILLIWPGHIRFPSAKLIGAAVLLALLPLLLYAYIPLRGTGIWNNSPFNEIYQTPLAVLNGIIHPRFAPDAATLWHYFTAGSPGSLGEVLSKAVGNTWFVSELVRDEIGVVWLGLGLSGLLLTIWRDRAWGAAIWTLLVSDILLAFYYRQGNVSAYFLPASFVIVVGMAEVMNGVQRLNSRLLRQPQPTPPRNGEGSGSTPPPLWGRLGGGERLHLGRFIPWSSAVVALACVALPLVFLSRNFQAANHNDDWAMDAYWRTVLSLNLEQGAGLVAHWSDLTPLWYFQQAEGRRPDLLGLYLPTLTQIKEGLLQGNTVYLAGPLSGWYSNLQQEMRLTPWGPLVRLDLADAPPPAVKSQKNTFDKTLGNVLVLHSGSLLTDEAISAGQSTSLTLTWTSLAPIQRDLHISLRLRQNGRLAMQQDERIISPWFPLDTVEPSLDFWSLHRLRIPEGLQPGQYALQAVIYELDGPELSLDSGGAEVNLGILHIAPQIVNHRLPMPAITLAPCIELVALRPDATTALIGAQFGVQLLWEARCQPTNEVALRFFIQNGTGRQEIDHRPLDALYPPTQWKAGQRVLTKSILRLPGNLTEGAASLSLDAVDPASGQPFGRHWGALPLPGSAGITRLSLANRPHQTDAPPMANRVDASFGGQIRLLGYQLSTDSTTGALTVRMAWQTEQVMDQSYSVFLHLLDSDGQIVAQRDAVPRDGQLPTSIWLPGEVVTDSYVLQPAQPLTAGTYTLIAGLYDSTNWQRLPVESTQTSGSGDFITLDTITYPPNVNE